MAKAAAGHLFRHGKFGLSLVQDMSKPSSNYLVVNVGLS